MTKTSERRRDGMVGNLLLVWEDPGANPWSGTSYTGGVHNCDPPAWPTSKRCRELDQEFPYTSFPCHCSVILASFDATRATACVVKHKKKVGVFVRVTSTLRTYQINETGNTSWGINQGSWDRWGTWHAWEEEIRGG